VQLLGAAKTRMVLNQTEGIFLDFRRQDFPLASKNMYLHMLDAHFRNDKLGMMNHLSFPMYEVGRCYAGLHAPLQREVSIALPINARD